ncbi:hypothetical protein Trydic_g14965 [Trypoxylus dichotomus]
MDNECVEMDLSTRPRDPPAADSCKVRVAKSVFSIRSLVDLGDAGEKLEDVEGAVLQCDSRLLNKDFRRRRDVNQRPKINLDFFVKKLKGAKKVFYNLNVPFEDEKRDDPERKARREAFLKKRKEFYSDYKKVQQAKVLIMREEYGCDMDVGVTAIGNCVS